MNHGNHAPCGNLPAHFGAILAMLLRRVEKLVAVKALLIGIPLYIVMRIAARQAARERYEAMQMALSRPAGRLVFRFRNADPSPTLVRQARTEREQLVGENMLEHSAVAVSACHPLCNVQS
eukprot:1140829-Pelagomonas_calceolata.AAC.1